MEQHYIITFGVAGEPPSIYYTTGIVIKEYPGNPITLLSMVLEEIEKTSPVCFRKRIPSEKIGIKMMVKVN